MSSATPSSSDREVRLYVQDMVSFCDRVLRYSAGLTQAEFISDAMRYDATLRNLELMGEAATHVPDALRSQAPGIPWRQIIATRNRLIHAYLGIDNDTVWSIVRDDVPALKSSLLVLLAQT